MRTGLLAALVALVLAPAAHAGGPTMRVGVTAQIAVQADPELALAEVRRAKAAGFDSIRLIQHWLPGQTEPSGGDLGLLKNAVFAAGANGMEVVVALSHPGSRTTPLTEQQRKDFAAFAAALATELPTVRHYTIGNEPNLNRFWLPQFGPSGENVAAPAYLALLAETYDALKSVSPKIIVMGGALSPRGSDNPNLSRHTHSPTRFLLDMGAALRASGRTLPVMDALSINPFPENSSTPPTTTHPTTTSIGIADYPKLVRLLDTAFRGTGQRGATLPIYYGEFGVEALPPAPKSRLYTGAEPTTTKPVPEATQAAYYRQAIALAFCQPTVRGIYLFLSVDDSWLPGWQSGLYYPDRTAKSSLVPVRRAARQARGGVVARCPGMRLTPRVRVDFETGRLQARFSCDIDCRFTLRLERGPGRSAVVSRTGLAAAGHASTRLRAPKLAPGTYRLTISFRAPVNPGRTVVKRSAEFTIP